MKNLLTIATLSIASTQAFADGFSCRFEDEALNIKVYNHTQPEFGTRNAAVMIASDLDVSSGNSTIAVFRDTTETLDSQANIFVARVDLRYTEISRKGELIAGTKLGYLKNLILDVDFKYGMNLESGDETTGVLTLVKRNGKVIQTEGTCTRYLKN